MSASIIEEIRKAREAVRAADDAVFAQQNRVRTRELQLAALRRQGPRFAEQVAALERDLKLLNESVARDRAGLASLNDRLGTLVGGLVLEQSPQQLIARLDDALPCVLFPLRIETRFMTGANGGRELWLRVYPDDIAVHTHEKELTRDEADTGVDYWSARRVAASVPDAQERERIEQGAWRAFATAYGGTRAAWIASEIRRRAEARPENPDTPFLVRARILGILKDPQTTSAAKRAAILAMLTDAHPYVEAIRDPVTTLLAGDLTDERRQEIAQHVDTAVLTYLGFDLEALKPESWSRAPRTGVMPDRFVMIAVTGETRSEFPFPNAVPSTLILGPNPQKLETELAQNAGDLVVGGDFAWIWDFEAAIAVGMAMRVPLPEPFASAGFDRLMVLGMRLSGEPSDHKGLLEELIDNHHFSPAGMGFIAQGTPTNHTADVKAGFSTDDAEGDGSFALETATPEPPAAEDLEKTDAQRLAEAWDVDYERLAILANAGQRDVALAKLMNRALWPATIGYFLEELLETDAADNDRVRRFFTSDVVRARQPARDPRRQTALRPARHECLQSLAGQREDRWRRDGVPASRPRGADEDTGPVAIAHEPGVAGRFTGRLVYAPAQHPRAAADLRRLPAARRYVPDIPVESRAPDDRREFRRQQSDGSLFPGHLVARHPAHERARLPVSAPAKVVRPAVLGHELDDSTGR